MGEIDFRGALRQLDELADVPAATRHRAFGVWVALFDLADESGRLEVTSRQLATVLGGLSLRSWARYKTVLIRAGLIEPGPPRHRSRPQVFVLVPPRR